jgi:putative ABC transport system permease protein
VPEAQLRTFDLELDLIPVADLLAMAVSGAMFPRQVDVSISFVLLLVGALVLGVACVNFANLATASAAHRAREIGLRKAVGAGARQIAAQYLAEVFLLAPAALLLAVALIGVGAPVLEAAVGVDLGAVLSGGIPWLPLSLLLVVVTLVAGAYPALLLSRVAPVAALRAGQSRAGSPVLGAWLVGVQFAVVALLLVAVTVVYLQNRELERTGLGVATDPLLVIENDARITGVVQQTLRDQLLRLPDVVSATLMVTPPWTDPDGVMPITTAPDVAAVQRTALAYVVGEDFFETFDVPLLAGRSFDAQRPQDILAFGGPPTGPGSVVISRALAEELGTMPPAELVGRQIYNGRTSFEIIGVVENNVLSISAARGPRPRVYLFNPLELRFHVVKIPANDVSGAIAAVDALWQKLAPNVAIKRRFADEYFNDSYVNFARINQAFSALSFVAVLIAAIGLFAIALSVANRRRSEIGVRKILGGNARQMTLMLLAAFSKPVVIANLVAWPLAYMAARTYVNLFISPIDLTAAPFLACLAVTVLVALLAVLRQTLHAARVKPATVLRYE